MVVLLIQRGVVIPVCLNKW